MKEMSELLKLRREKLDEFAKEGINPFPNDFKVLHNSQEIRERFSKMEANDLEKVEEEFSLAGRIVAKGILVRRLFSISKTEKVRFRHIYKNM